MKKSKLLWIPLASFLPGIGTCISVGAKLYSKRKEPHPTLSEEEIKRKTKQFWKEMRDLWTIIALVFLLLLVFKRAIYYNHQIALLKNHTEQITKQKDLR